MALSVTDEPPVVPTTDDTPADPPPGNWWGRPLPAASWMPTAITVLCVVSVIGITLWQLHPSLLLSSSTSTGGDNGGHYALPAFLRTNLLPHWQLSGWDPGWYDGFPLYTYYFLLPDLLTALVSHLISYGLAFKLSTILGSVLLPVAAWAMGRLFGMRRAFPAALAALTLCFLFDGTFTIDGGNLFSTLAGEYSFSLSLSLALLFLGLMAYGLRTGRFRGLTAVVWAFCLLAHLIPAAFALIGAALLIGLEMLPPKVRPRDTWNRHPSDRVVPALLSRRQVLWWGASTIGLGLLLSAFWWVPFGLDRAYENAMGYQNVTNWVTILLPQADLWALILAGLAAIAAFAVRSRFGIVVSLLGGISALVVVVDPQGALYNVRVLPLYFLCVFLMVGWGIATLVSAICDLIDRYQERQRTQAALFDFAPATAVAARRWPTAAVFGPLVALIVAVVVVATPFVATPSELGDIGITPGARVSDWAELNYGGYEASPAYPEYRAVVEAMEHVGRTHGCGQSMWEYSPDLGRFGTTMALMLLPYWSNGCIGSMEGLLFESSSTTPFHFLNQAELSAQPSDPQASCLEQSPPIWCLHYSSVNVTQGVEHLQLLGVRYFMATSATVQAQADADPALKQVMSTGPWTSTVRGVTYTTTWKIYQVLHSPLVTPLANEPAVEKAIAPDQSSWLPSAQAWYNNPSRWNVELAQSGPANWPRVAIGDTHPPRRATRPTTVTKVHETDRTVSFHVSRLGTPVLVKVSYFPNWHVHGGTGPYRVTPNLMVVVPTSHTVTLTYGHTSAETAGTGLSLVGLATLFIGGAIGIVRRHRRLARRSGGATPAT